MSTLIVEGGATLTGSVVAPPDKSITHRALFFAALGAGETMIHPLGGGRDNRASLGALRALGVSIDVLDGGRAKVMGVESPRNLRAPSGPIDCMNSGTTMRVLSGVIAASGLEVVLTGDESLSQRPMTRLMPLEAMGASIAGRSEGGKIFPPITVRGAKLHGASHRLAIASAQLKTALILAGLWATGETTIVEPSRSRDHTERMLRRLGAPIEEESDGTIRVRPIASPWRAGEIKVAPDPSSAAFFIAAALVTGSDDLIVETGTNPTRAGFLEAIEKMGAELLREPLGDVAGEPVERIRVRASSRDRLRGAVIDGGLTLRAIDEIPLLAGVAAFAEGRTEIKDAGELRVKETDRIAAMHAVLRAFDVEVKETEDGLVIDGDPARLRWGSSSRAAEGRGDHRIAMTAAIMGLGVTGKTHIAGAEHIEVSFPGFERELARLGASVSIAD